MIPINPVFIIKFQGEELLITRAETNTAFACSNSHLLNERIVEYLIKIN